MKKQNNLNKIIILVAFIIITAITIIVMIFVEKIEVETPETVAKTVLTKTYGASLQDYENLTNALVQSMENDKILMDYLHKMYDDQLADNGYKQFLEDRIPSIGAKIAYAENSDLKVTSIELQPKDAVEGSKRFAFTLQLQTEKDVSKSFTYTGSISLIQEDGNWKVESISTH